MAEVIKQLVEKSYEEQISFERFIQIAENETSNVRKVDGFGFEFYEEDSMGFGWSRCTFSDEELHLYQEYLKQNPKFLGLGG